MDRPLQAEELDRIVEELERPGRVVTLGGGRRARRRHRLGP